MVYKVAIPTIPDSGGKDVAKVGIHLIQKYSVDELGEPVNREESDDIEQQLIISL